MSRYLMFFIVFFISLAAGCVRREIHLNSNPSGAPVWVDEEYFGETPVRVDFVHYGSRRIRIGPIRNEKGHTEFMRENFIYPTRAPWHQMFPVDFFVKVLWPFPVEDIHTVDIDLREVEHISEEEANVKIREILKEARIFREKALHPPEDR